MNKTRIIFIGVVLILASLFVPGEISAAPHSQKNTDNVIQIVLVLDVSGSMDTEVFTGIVPEDLLSLLLRRGEIESDPEFQRLQEQVQEAEENPEIAEAKAKWEQAAQELDDWMRSEHGQDTSQVSQEIHELLSAAGCDDSMNQSFATVGSLDQLDFSLNAACPEGTITDDLRQEVIDLLPYLDDSTYQELRQDWKAAFESYDGLLEEGGYKSARQQLEDIKTSTGYDEVQAEIDRLVEVYNIPTRLDLAKAAAVNLIDLSSLDKANTGRDSRLGLVTFTTQAQLEQNLTLEHESLKRLIRGLAPQHRTNIGDGLTIGLNELEGNLDPDQPMLIILLSDGHTNEGMTSSEILGVIPSRANDMDVTICTAGFADVESDVDFVLLEGLAQKTEGEYLFTNSGAELGSFFVACRESAVGKDLAGQISGVVEAGNLSEAGRVEIKPHTCELDATLNYLSGSPEIQLVNPGGQNIDPSQSGASFQERNQIQLFSVENPQSGEWIVRVSNDDARGESAAFSILISTTPCEGPAPEAEETDRYAELPFLLREKGMPYVTGGVVLLILLLSAGVVLIIRWRQRGDV